MCLSIPVLKKNQINCRAINNDSPAILFEDWKFPLAEDELASLEIRLVSIDNLAFMHPRDSDLPIL